MNGDDQEGASDTDVRVKSDSGGLVEVSLDIQERAGSVTIIDPGQPFRQLSLGRSELFGLMASIVGPIFIAICLGDTRRFLTHPQDSGGNQTGNPHAGLTGVAARGWRPQIPSPPPRRALMNLPDRPVDESPTCVQDNNMHTNRTDGRQRGGIA